MKKQYTDKFCIESLQYTLDLLNQNKDAFNNIDWCVDCAIWLHKFGKITNYEFDCYSYDIMQLQNRNSL